MSQESGGWGVAHMCTPLGFYIVTVSMEVHASLTLVSVAIPLWPKDLQVTGFVEVH